MKPRNPELLRIIGWLAVCVLCFLLMVLSALADLSNKR
jgi:hypothetical protein